MCIFLFLVLPSSLAFLPLALPPHLHPRSPSPLAFSPIPLLLPLSPLPPYSLLLILNFFLFLLFPLFQYEHPPRSSSLLSFRVLASSSCSFSPSSSTSPAFPFPP